MRKYFWISLALSVAFKAREIQKYFLMFLSFLSKSVKVARENKLKKSWKLSRETFVILD
jgi:hypothetical protein